MSEIINEFALDYRRLDAPFLRGTAAFWLIAVHEGYRGRDSGYDKLRLADPNGRVPEGLTLARNAVAHGLVVVSRSQVLTSTENRANNTWALTRPPGRRRRVHPAHLADWD